MPRFERFENLKLRARRGVSILFSVFIPGNNSCEVYSMSVDKKQAARIAATMYSTESVRAVMEYMKLTNQLNQFAMEKWDSIQEEMLSLLPLYRHPSYSMDQERARFMCDFSVKLQFVGWSEPGFLTRLKNENIDKEIIGEIEKYVRDSEVRRNQLATCEYERNALRKIIQAAEVIYRENIGIRSSERNKLVVQALGLSSGKREENIDKEKVYKDYLDLVRKKGMSRREATETVQQMHEIQSFDATLKVLFSYRKELLDKLEADSPLVKPEVQKYTEGLILQRR